MYKLETGELFDLPTHGKAEMTDNSDLKVCEKSVLGIYDATFASLYASVWDPRLSLCHEMMIDSLFRTGMLPAAAIDAAAGTGGLSVRLAKRGIKVTANELSPEMKREIYNSRSKHGVEEILSILDPGVLWRHLVRVVGPESYDLVICTGASLSHCDPSPMGNLKESLSSLGAVVRPGGHLLVDCKRYAADGVELLASGEKRAPTVSDSENVQWEDRCGNTRRGCVFSHFAALSDRSLDRIVTYEESVDNATTRSTWKIRTWPIGQQEIREILLTEGLLLKNRIMSGKSVAFEYLLFAKP